ncbi:hypothetical protein Gohar_019709 [Gossypium harknessii]|uniref:RNase H type-1 domain-containing protein n=1 Tax=Gossypium harknessii TaxID=34285 RepID=A0A7J9IFY0_9ROSI|nr:hypothetical protein [Gossypium harknessii]
MIGDALEFQEVEDLGTYNDVGKISVVGNTELLYAINYDNYRYLKVANFLDPDGCWKWSLLERYFNRELFEQIAACHLPNDTLAECVSRFFSLDLAEWVNSNLRGEFQVGSDGDESWIYFAVIEKVEEMVSSTKCFAEHVIETSQKGSRTRDSQVDMERWCLPNHGWIKINTDGAANRNKNWLAAGELWAILHRLEIGETRGYTKVIVEFYCMVVVDMIKECSESTPSMTIVRKIKEVTRQISIVKYQFMNRENNLVADWLAKSCLSNDVNLVYIDAPTPRIRRLLLDDKLGKHHVRIN